MKKYKIRRTIFEDINLDENQVMKLSEAARILDLATVGSVKSLMKTGRLSWIEDPGKYQGRLLVLRSEVEELARKRRQAGGVDGG